MNKVLLSVLLVTLLAPVAVVAGGNREVDEDSPVVVVDRSSEIDATAEPGILVSRVADDSPAQRAGIIRGDIILALDSARVNSVAELRDVLSDYEAGRKVEILVSRGGEERTLGVTLETRLNRPALGIEGAAERFPRLGMVPEPYPMPAPFGGGPFMYRFHGDGSDGPAFGMFGDIVMSVEEGGPADQAGILEGDIIVRVGDAELDDLTIAEAVAALSPNDTVEIEVRRRMNDDQTETLVLSVTLSANDDGGAYLGIGYFPMRMRAFDRDEFMDRFGRRMPGFDPRGGYAPRLDDYPRRGRGHSPRPPIM